MSTSESSQSSRPKGSNPTRRPPEVDKHVDTFLSTMCDTSRRYILELLANPDDETATDLPERRAGDIARLIGLSPATTSEHLRQLSAVGLIMPRREGNVVYYRLCNRKLVQSFQDLLQALARNYAASLDQQ